MNERLPNRTVTFAMAAVVGVLAAVLASVLWSRPSAIEQREAAFPRTNDGFYGTSGSFEHLMTEVQAAAVVEVTDIAVQWNSDDGREWSIEDDDGGTPFKLSRVTATVRESIVGDVPKPTITFWAMGDARKRVEGEGVPPRDSISGGFSLNDRFLVLLGERKIAFKGGPRRLYMLRKDFEGNWRIEGNQAHGASSRWSGAVADVVRQIRTFYEG